MLRYYIATHFGKKDDHNQLMHHLGSESITYDWTPLVYALGSGKELEISELEINGVKNADILFVILPGGRGTHIEIGVALGNNIPILLYLPDQNLDSMFYHSKYVITIHDWEQFKTIGKSVVTNGLSGLNLCTPI